MKLARSFWFAGIAFVAGCTAISSYQYKERFGTPEPRERVVEKLPPGDIDYWRDVRPIVENRCVVCHACYDAPCQLKMSSIEGIERGASKAKVYVSTRLKAAPTTRLFQDAHSVAAWREQGFFPVLNEYPQSKLANRDASVMYRILQLKEDHPLPNAQILPDSFDLSLDRKQFCTQAENFDKFSKDHPLWGMPYALPAMPADEQDVLMRWIEQGATYEARKPLAKEYLDQIEYWEQFLNGDSLKQQLMSRYIYEHLYLAHLHFSEIPTIKFFKVVRSATPPGEPIQLIATRRPFNDPGVARVYYRIQEDLGSIVEKTHMPYRLDEQRMQRWETLFIDRTYEVTALPSYDEKEASNPFRTFEQLPVSSRYKFMLDEAEYTIMGFIKGPVCRGQVALNVINDQFWVFFIDPDSPKVDLAATFYANQIDNLQLPASKENIYSPLINWRKYASRQKALLAAKDQFLRENLSEPDAITLDLLWDGDGTNENASLTIFRHFDTATVKKGLLGQPPQTAWVIGYSLLERIYYLLVAGYDPFGNLGHQFVTRIYMDFLRMESEGNFLLFLPEEARISERDYWYRNTNDEMKQYLTLPNFEMEVQPSIDYVTDEPKAELYKMLEERLQKVLPQRHTMTAIKDPYVRTQLDRLNQLIGTPVTLMPQAGFLQIQEASRNEYVTLVHNVAHYNITSMFSEKKDLEPEADTLSVIPGFIGAYPNALYVVRADELEDFVDRIANLENESDYASLLDAYGVRRTSPGFWRHSDTVHNAFAQQYPLISGLLDYSRLENR